MLPTGAYQGIIDTDALGSLMLIQDIRIKCSENDSSLICLCSHEPVEQQIDTHAYINGLQKASKSELKNRTIDKQSREILKGQNYGWQHQASQSKKLWWVFDCAGFDNQGRSGK